MKTHQVAVLGLVTVVGLAALAELAVRLGMRWARWLDG